MIAARLLAESLFNRIHQFSDERFVLLADVQADLMPAQCSFRDVPAQEPHQLARDWQIAIERLFTMRLRYDLSVRAKGAQFAGCKIRERFVITHLAPAGIATRIILLDQRVNLRRGGNVFDLIIPADDAQITLEMRFNRAIDAALPVADSDRLFDPDRMRTLHLRQSRSLPPRHHPFPLLRSQLNARFAPQFGTLDLRHYALRCDSPHIFAFDIELVGKSRVVESCEQINSRRIDSGTR